MVPPLGEAAWGQVGLNVGDPLYFWRWGSSLVFMGLLLSRCAVALLVLCRGPHLHLQQRGSSLGATSQGAPLYLCGGVPLQFWRWAFLSLWPGWLLSSCHVSGYSSCGVGLLSSCIEGHFLVVVGGLLSNCVWGGCSSLIVVCGGHLWICGGVLP